MNVASEASELLERQKRSHAYDVDEWVELVTQLVTQKQLLTEQLEDRQERVRKLKIDYAHLAEELDGLKSKLNDLTAFLKVRKYDSYSCSLLADDALKLLS